MSDIVASPETKYMLFMLSHKTYYFLHATLCSEDTNPMKIITDHSFHQGQPFLIIYGDITTG